MAKEWLILTPAFPLNGILIFLDLNASKIVINWILITLKTSTSILLNSSKHTQAPVFMTPKNKVAIVLYEFLFEQLNTITYLPIALLKSFIVSVLPVPAGPWRDPPLK